MCVADRAGGAQARSLPNSNNTRLLTADTLTRATEANAHLEDLAACVPRTLTSVPGVHTVRSTLHRSKRIDVDEQLHRLGDVDRNVPSKAHRASAGSAGRHVEAIVNVDVLDGLVAGDVVDVVGDVEHGHCTCWSMLETSVRRPRAGCCTRMMIGAP